MFDFCLFEAKQLHLSPFWFTVHCINDCWCLAKNYNKQTLKIILMRKNTSTIICLIKRNYVLLITLFLMHDWSKRSSDITEMEGRIFFNFVKFNLNTKCIETCRVRLGLRKSSLILKYSSPNIPAKHIIRLRTQVIQCWVVRFQKATWLSFFNSGPVPINTRKKLMDPITVRCYTWLPKSKNYKSIVFILHLWILTI